MVSRSGSRPKYTIAGVDYITTSWMTDGLFQNGDPVYRGQLVVRDTALHRFIDSEWVCLHKHRTRDEADTCAKRGLRDYIRSGKDVRELYALLQADGDSRNRKAG